MLSKIVTPYSFAPIAAAIKKDDKADVLNNDQPGSRSSANGMQNNALFANDKHMSILRGMIYGDLQANSTNADIVSTYLGLLNAEKINATNINSSQRFFESPSRNGYVPAQFLKGVCWFEGASSNGESSNRLRGLSLIIAAADNGNFAPAWLYSAGVYARGDKGLNIQSDPKQAFAMYRRAAAATSDILAGFYTDGSGETKDLHGCKVSSNKVGGNDLIGNESLRSYEQLHGIALRNVGLCYLRGFGVAQDIKIATRYLAEAAKARTMTTGDETALRILRKLLNVSRLRKQRRAAEEALRGDLTTTPAIKFAAEQNPELQQQPTVAEQFANAVDQDHRLASIAGKTTDGVVRGNSKIVSMVPGLSVQRKLQRPTRA